MSSAKSKKRQNRDDFTSKTIRMLRDMASGICSRPECSAFTSGSFKLRDNAGSIGVAAHICAAAPGGKRYDESMSPEQRSSIDNGIWLCQSCSKLIDTDELQFPKELLIQWKASAEQRSTKLIGQKFISQNQHESKIRSTIGQAIAQHISGYGHPLDMPLLDTIHGYGKNLEELDPRFSVKVSTHNDVVTHELHAKEDVSIQMLVQRSPEIADALRSMIETGQKIELPSGSFTIAGSPLLESIVAKGINSLSIGSIPETYDATLQAVDGDRRLIVCPFQIQAIRGISAFSLSGSCLDGFISFRYESDKNYKGGTINLRFDTTQWKGTSLSTLSHWSRLLKLLDFLNINKNATIQVCVSTKTDDINIGNSRKDQEVFIRHLTFVIDHVRNVRDVLDQCPTATFNANDICHETDATLRRLAHLKNGSQIITYKAGHEILTATGETRELSRLSTSLAPLIIRETINELTLLGNRVRPPSIIHHITDYTVRLDEGGGQKLAIIEATSDTKLVMHLDTAPWILLED